MNIRQGQRGAIRYSQSSAGHIRNRACKWTCCVTFWLAVVTGATAGDYVEVSYRAFMDSESSDDSPIGTLVRIGYQAFPETCAGIYGMHQSTDRKLPAKADDIWGMGVFFECSPDLDAFFFLPYVGLSLGLIDPSGINSDTLLHVSGSMGIRVPLSIRWALMTGATMHWVDEEFFDYKATVEHGIEASRTDFTGDLGFAARF